MGVAATLSELSEWTLQTLRTRLIILTDGKSNHKIKIAGTGRLAVGIRPLDYKYTFLLFPKMLIAGSKMG